MKRHYKSKEKRKLKPGELYKFFVLKKVSIPDDKEYFVLIDLFGDKHLLQCSYYKQYPIRINEYCLCRVDKINCQGRIFLEPVHPQIKINNIYDFKVLEFKILNSNKGHEKKFFRMQAPNGIIAHLAAESENEFTIGDKMSCRIINIKKAEIFVQIADIRQANDS